MSLQEDYDRLEQQFIKLTSQEEFHMDAIEKAKEMLKKLETEVASGLVREEEGKQDWYFLHRVVVVSPLHQCKLATILICLDISECVLTNGSF